MCCDCGHVVCRVCKGMRCRVCWLCSTSVLAISSIVLCSHSHCGDLFGCFVVVHGWVVPPLSPSPPPRVCLIRANPRSWRKYPMSVLSPSPPDHRRLVCSPVPTVDGCFHSVSRRRPRVLPVTKVAELESLAAAQVAEFGVVVPPVVLPTVPACCFRRVLTVDPISRVMTSEVLEFHLVYDGPLVWLSSFLSSAQRQ